MRSIVIDDYSRAVAGYYLGFEPPSSLRTTLALRQGIWRKGDPHWEICGIPDVLYTDNGSDFRSKHLEQVAADLKIRSQDTLSVNMGGTVVSLLYEGVRAGHPRFYVATVDGELEFVPDLSGAMTTLLWHQHESEQSDKRR
jgi:Integrase core domain